jgi:hypothetical protein
MEAPTDIEREGRVQRETDPKNNTRLSNEAPMTNSAVPQARRRCFIKHACAS